MAPESVYNYKAVGSTNTEWKSGMQPDDNHSIAPPEAAPPVAPRPQPSSLWSALSWVRDLAFSVLIAVILIVFIYQPVKVEGTSMMPTLTDQERIFINKFTYHFGLGVYSLSVLVAIWSAVGGLVISGALWLLWATLRYGSNGRKV